MKMVAAPLGRATTTMIWCSRRRVGKSECCYAALTPATKAFTALDSCSACFDTSDAAVKT
jgi:hypothetical protein